MDVKIKRLSENAKIPTYAADGDAGMDVVATRMFYDEFGNACYGTGLAFEIPEGYEMQIRPRSSISKYEVVLVNSPGTLDAGYRGELILKYKYVAGGHSRNHIDKHPSWYEVGDKIAQILIKPVPYIKFIEVDELTETVRDSGGFGSTGK